MRYPATRPPIRRLKGIDLDLRARNWPTDKTLASALEVDPRTIRRDLEFLRGQCNAPIEFDRVQGSYYSTEPTFRLTLPQLSHGELIALFLTERMTRQYRGAPFEPDLRQAITRLGEMLPADLADPLGPEPAVRGWHLEGSERAIPRKSSVSRPNPRKSHGIYRVTKWCSHGQCRRNFGGTETALGSLCPLINHRNRSRTGGNKRAEDVELRSDSPDASVDPTECVSTRNDS